MYLKQGGLHEKHAVETWSVGNHLGSVSEIYTQGVIILATPKVLKMYGIPFMLEFL